MLTTGFQALDKLTGGFAERKAYLVYGDAKEAVTAFALSFLVNGAQAGRPVAMVTERNPATLVEEAQRYGFNLNEPLEKGELLLFEYPDNVTNHARNLSDDTRIIREFQNLIGKHSIDRLVLDPVTPLLISPNQQVAANRFQQLSTAFSGLGATAIYVLHGPGGVEYVPVCRDAAEGVLRLEAFGSGTARMVFERWPQDAIARESQLEFGVVAGVGLVPVGLDRAAAAFADRRLIERHPPRERQRLISVPQFASAPSAGLVGDYEKPTVLLMHPDTAQRSALAAALRKNFVVDEAHGAIDGLAALGDASPDVLVLAQEMRGVPGSAIVHKLRQSGNNLPVILVGSRIRRLSDQVSLLQAGVDLVMEYPVNGQLLTLHIDNLLRRIGRLKDPLNRDAEPPRRVQRPGVNCTTDVKVFSERAAEEINFSLDEGLPIPMFVMYYSSGKPLLEELSSSVLMTTRSTDMVFVGTRGIAVLLPEARAVEPFLARFSTAWNAGPPPLIEQPRVGGQRDLQAYLEEFISAMTGAGFSVPEAPKDRERNKSLGATKNNGAKV